MQYFYNFDIQAMLDGELSMGLLDIGREWRNMRKSFLRGVKMYGTGLHELETLLADILEELVEVIEKKGNQGFVIEYDMYRTVAASMWLMVSNSDHALSLSGLFTITFMSKFVFSTPGNVKGNLIPRIHH